jgi:enterochelin esterase-like enzyme
MWLSVAVLIHNWDIRNACFLSGRYHNSWEKIFTCIIPHVDAKTNRAIDRFLVSQSDRGVVALCKRAKIS